jgi:hypothetical protein
MASVKDAVYDDDDSENDSDYAPEDDHGDENGIEDAEETKLSTITYSRKRKVDDLWAMMQDESLGSNNSIKVDSSSSSSATTNSNKSSKKRSSDKKTKDILASIFGKSQTSKIMGKSSSGSSTSTADELSIKENARKAVLKLQKKTMITEKMKFAGQEIT